MQLQHNLTTGKPYQGGNQAKLLKAKDVNGYISNAWATFIQAKNMSKKLVNAKGKGIHLRTFAKDTDKEGNVVYKPIHFVVFNEDLMVNLAATTEAEPVTTSESFVATSESFNGLLFN